MSADRLDPNHLINPARGTDIITVSIPLASAAEATVLVLDSKPELIPQVRPYLLQPPDGFSPVQMVFGTLDLNHDGVITLAELDKNALTRPFQRFYHSGGVFGDTVDAQIRLTPDNLSGDPAFLFSFHALRQLTEYYTTNRRIGEALLDKLDEAEELEDRGNAKARARLLNAFRNQLMAQKGKSFTAAQVHVLIVLSETL